MAGRKVERLFLELGTLRTVPDRKTGKGSLSGIRRPRFSAIGYDPLGSPEAELKRVQRLDKNRQAQILQDAKNAALDVIR